MRVSHSLATIGIVFALFGAAIPPSNALNLDHPIPMGKTKKQKAAEAAEKKASEDRMKALKKLNALGGGPHEKERKAAEKKASEERMEALKKLNALGGGPKKNSGDVKGVTGVVTGKHLNGTSSTPRNGDWTTSGHGTATATKTVAAPKTIAATTTPQTRYQPVHSLGVKPSR